MNDQHQEHNEQAQDHEEHQNHAEDSAAGKSGPVFLGEHRGELRHDGFGVAGDAPRDQRVRQGAEELHEERAERGTEHGPQDERGPVEGEGLPQLPAGLVAARGAHDLRD
ncbi:hypothetical protein E3T24_06595 [Cryobacterium sp. TmT2-59]|nr:hypothetical protein E3T24_06595 [Cryobacterium sp. TmT2-59]